MDMKLHHLIESVKRTAADQQLWSPNDCIIVAVSGGPDSIALLHVLHHISVTHMPLRLVCAHANHGFRQESIEEAEMVKRIASDLDIPFEMAELDIPSYMKISGMGPQEASRIKRYEFLLQVASQYDSKRVALAHHADDQAETVIMRLLRGSGPSGLSGMKIKRREKNVELIRPFLRIYKSDLLEVCEANGYEYAVDQTNLQSKYRRNAVRLDILPFLGQYNKQIASSLNQLAEVMTAEDDFVEQAAKDVYRNLVQHMDGRLAFKVPSFLGLHVALQRRLIKLILNYLSTASEISDFHKIERIRDGILRDDATTWSFDLGGGVTCQREYEQICFFSHPVSQESSYTYHLEEAASELWLSEIGKVLTVSVSSWKGQLPSEAWMDLNEAVFDKEQLSFPLTVRSRKPGDLMTVMGLNGSKKVKDIFIDDKIPPSLRQRIPMVVDSQGRILWIPGVRRSDIATVESNTNSVLHMRLKEPESQQIM